jgi:hypothetical protein
VQLCYDDMQPSAQARLGEMPYEGIGRPLILESTRLVLQYLFGWVHINLGR